MPNMKNVAKNTSAKKRHDDGLSAKDRIFVHSLRLLLDPKGKSKVSSPPKGFVSQALASTITLRKTTALPADKQSMKRPGKPRCDKYHGAPSWQTLPAALRRTLRGGIPARSRRHPAVLRINKKRNTGTLVGLGPDVAEKQSKPSEKKVSPSRLKRAEKRKLAREQARKDEFALPKKPSRVENAVVKSTGSRMVDGSARLGESSHPGVSELTVVIAFGGVAALRELAKVRNTSQSKFPVWVPAPFASGYRPKMRDFSVASKNVGVVTSKLRNHVDKSTCIFDHTHEKSSEKKVEVVEKGKSKEKGNSEAKGLKRPTPGQSRRLQRRSLGRKEESEKKVTVEVAIQSDKIEPEAPASSGSNAIDNTLRRVAGIGRNLKKMKEMKAKGQLTRELFVSQVDKVSELMGKVETELADEFDSVFER